MNIPPQTSDIFQFLSKGHFVSLNSHDPAQTHLYEVISRHEESLREYFVAIDLHLFRGNGYFYFARPERNGSYQERFDKVLRQLDLLHFLLTYHPGFGPGLTFTRAEIWTKCQQRPDLLLLLEKLPLKPAGAATEEKLRLLLTMLEKDTFLESESEGIYRVLTSFDYLLQLLDRIELTYDRHSKTA